MKKSTSKAALACGVLVTAGAVGLMAAAPALSATDATSTTVRKSVQVLADGSGSIGSVRIYTQIQSTGDGQVTFVDRVNGALRNLNAFGAPATVDGDTATFDYTVNGLSNGRTLQDFPQSDLPITIKASATLDGQPIEVADVVGRSGLLKMTYEVENTTSEPSEISWTDGSGETVTKTVDVPLPYVGSMEMELPDSYSEINAPGASAGGTGRNSTRLSWTLLLYPPLGDTKATVTYEARVTNASLPQVDATFLPTPPSGNATTASAKEQYKGGQETGAKLTDGATQIDDNLLKLADGAGQLNEGLAQLLAGANQLSTGLNDTAVPGSQALEDGSRQVADGLVTLQNGLADLPDTVGSSAEFQTLIAGFEAVLAGIGGPTDTPSDGTLLGGINGISGGLAQVGAGLDNPAISFPASTGPCDSTKAPGQTGYCGLKDALQLLSFGLSNPSCSLANPTNPANPCGALQGVDGVADALGAAAATGGDLDQLIVAAKGTYAALVALASCPTTLPGDPGIIANIPAPAVMLANGISNTSPCYAQSSVVYGLALPANVLPAPNDKGGVKAQTQTAADALDSVSAGLSGKALPGVASMIGAIGTSSSDGTLLNGIAQLSAGSAALKSGVYTPCDEQDAGFPDNCGLYQVIELLEGGVFLLVDGISDQLAGNPKLTQLVDGADQVADGNAELASGLSDAADGSSQIADGLDQAVPGGTQIEDGAGRLSTEGTQQLIAAGQATTNDFGERYALMEAIDQRAADGSGLPNGPAEGTDGTEVTTTGAFGYTLAGATSAEGQNGLRFGLAALLIAAAAGIGVAFARR